MIGKPLLRLTLAITLGLGQWPATLVLAQGAGAAGAGGTVSESPNTQDHGGNPSLEFASTAENYCVAPVVLKVSKNVSMRMMIMPPLSGAFGSQTLVSVGGVDVRGMTPAQVYGMLRGKASDCVEVEVLDGDRRLETRKLFFIKSELPVATHYSAETFRQMLISLGGLREFGGNLIEGSAAPYDLPAIAQCHGCLEDREVVNKPGNSRRLLQALLLSQSMGDLKTAEPILNELLKVQNLDLSPAGGDGGTLQMIVRNLVALGQNQAALALCNAGLRSDEINSQPALEKFKLMRCFAELKEAEGVSASDSYAVKLASTLAKGSVDYYQNIVWLSDYFVRRGQMNRALSICEAVQAGARVRTLPPNPTALPLPSYVGLVSEQGLASFFYQSAWLKAKVGDCAAAKADLEVLSNYYKRAFGAANLTILNRVPEYFPTPAQVQEAITELENSRSLPAPPQAQIQPEYALFQRNDDLSQAGFSLLAAFYKAVSVKNETAALNSATSLLSLYGKQEVLSHWQATEFTRLNMFCALLGVSRTLSDQGWYSGSESILNKLQAVAARKNISRDSKEMADVMINAEHVVNASRSGLELEKPFSLLESVYHSTAMRGEDYNAGCAQRRSEDSWRVRLRLLAMGYYHAGDVARAKIFLDRALLPNLPTLLMPGDPAILSDDNIPEERFALLLGAACIIARQGDFASADKFAALARAEKCSLDEQRAAGILEYANIQWSAGRKTEAIAWLKENRTALLPLPSASLLDCLLERSSSPKRDDLGGRIDERLAELVLAQGDLRGAYKIIGESIAKSNINSPRSALLTAGELAERAGDFKSAAAYYEAVSSRYSSLPVRSSLSSREIDCVKKAVDMAERSGDCDRKTLARLYCALARQVSSRSPALAYAAYAKAVAATPDSDPGKADLIGCMNGFKAATSPSKPDKAQEKQQVASDIALRRKEAELAEKNGLPNAYTHWIVLGTLEARAGSVERAIADARHGVRVFNEKSGNFTRIGGGLVGYGALAEALRQAGAADRFDQLLKEAVERVRVVKGSGSVALQWQLEQVFKYYAVGDRQEKALAVLDELLSCDLTLGNYRLPDRNRFVFCGGLQVEINSSEQVVDDLRETALSTVKKGDSRFALLVLNKLLKAQRRQLGPTDRRIGVTYNACAQAEYRANNYAGAFQYFERALPILLRYQPEQAVIGMLGSAYQGTLAALGKQSILDEYEKRAGEKARREREAQNLLVLREQKALLRLEEAEVGIDWPVVKQRGLSLGLMEELLGFLDAYKKLSATGGSKLEQLKCLKRIERFGEDHNLPVLRIRYMALRVTLEEKLKPVDEEIKRENYSSLINGFIFIGDMPNARLWHRKLALLDEYSKESYPYLCWLDYGIQCGACAFPTSRVLSLEDELMNKPLDKLVGYESGYLQRIQSLYRNAARAAKSKSELESRSLIERANQLQSRIVILESIRADKEAKAFQARQEYLRQSPAERTKLAMAKVQQDIAQADWIAFNLDRGSLLSEWHLLSEGERAYFLSKYLEIARNLIKAHRGDLVSTYLAALHHKASGVDLKSICSSLDELIAIALQMGDRETAMTIINELVEMASSGQYLENEAAELRKQRELYLSFLREPEVNNVRLANEGQVRELARGFCVKRSILAWQLLRFNDCNNYGPGRKPVKSAVVKFLDTDSERLPLLLENDTAQYRGYARHTMAPFKPSPLPPETASPLNPYALFSLPPGDYKADSLRFSSIRFMSPGRTRIYISGGSICDGPVIWQFSQGSVSTKPYAGGDGGEATLEIWYDGEGTIRFDDRFNFSGLIYAPMARVEMVAPTGGNFKGAIVARDVLVDGNVTIKYDPSIEYLNGH
ncbi:MAG TPA: hypothetical protein PL012_11425 [Candidatus Obscuribacter sp.]|nr:hypothetical protein [Candidatus Obscuribacter sp.]